MITKEDSADLIQALGLPEIILNMYNGEKMPAPIDFSFGVPEAFFTMTGEEQLRYGNGHLFPIWDDGDFGIIVGYDRQRKGFVRFYLEQNGLESLPLYTYQQIMVGEFVGFWEDLLGEYNEEMSRCIKPMKKFALLFDFDYVDELLEELQEDVDYTDEEWLQSFITRIAS